MGPNEETGAASHAEAIPAAGSPHDLAVRAAELETVLAVERAENARRMSEVDGHMRVMRARLQELQADFRKSSSQREEMQREIDVREQTITDLQARLAEATAAAEDVAAQQEGVAAEFVAASVNRAQAAEEALAAAREQIAALEQRVAEAAAGGDEAAGAAVRKQLEERDAKLATQGKRLAELERQLAAAGREGGGEPDAEREKLAEELSRAAARIAELESAPAPAAASSADAPSDAASEDLPEQAEGLPRITGLWFERRGETFPAATQYLAREVKSRRPITVWLLHCELADLESKRVDSLLLAKHVNVVSATSFGLSDSGPHVVFERAVGEAADDWVGRIGPLPERIALAVVQQAAQGLRQAAFHAVRHGDLAPPAIRIDAAGHVQVADVGLADLLAPSDEDPATRLPENVAYAAPERLRGEAPADVAGDVYSLGCVLYFLLTGEAPFSGDKEEVLRAQAASGVPDPRETRPGITADVARLVARMTTFDAAQRPSAWDEVIVDVERRLPGGVSSQLRGNLRHRVARVVADQPVVGALAMLLPLILTAVLLYVVGTSGPTARERFDAAAREARVLYEKGEKDEAREMLQLFVHGVGDPAVEREAAEQLDAMK